MGSTLLTALPPVGRRLRVRLEHAGGAMGEEMDRSQRFSSLASMIVLA